MRLAAFTVDVDRDVNQACQGQICALSKQGMGQGQPRFESSVRGLRNIVDILNDLDIRGTFFFEGRTALEISKQVDLAALMKGHEVACHGFDHEDMTGEKSGIRPTDEQLAEILDKSKQIVFDLFGNQRPGFRAPYQASDQRLQDLLLAKGFRYESSLTMPIIDGKLRPFQMPNGLLQVPVASGTDAKGKKIIAYLWPMHEGSRPPEDYLHLIGQFEDGLLVIATHTWHMVENYCMGKMSLDQEDLQGRQLHFMLEEALESGLDFVRIDDYLDEHHGGSC